MHEQEAIRMRQLEAELESLKAGDPLACSGRSTGSHRSRTGGRGSRSGVHLVADTISVMTDSSEHDADAQSTWSGSLTNSLGSLGFKTGVSRSHKAQTSIERDLMRQLEILQESKQIEVDELKMKLKQREATIDTLERTVQVQGETIAMLREGMDALTMENSQGHSMNRSGSDRLTKPSLSNSGRRRSSRRTEGVGEDSRSGDRTASRQMYHRQQASRSRSPAPTRPPSRRPDYLTSPGAGRRSRSSRR